MSAATKDLPNPISEASGRDGAAPATPVTEPALAPQGPPTLAVLVDKYDKSPTLAHGVIARKITAELAKRDDGWDIALLAITAYVTSYRRPPVHKREREIYRMFEPERGMKRVASAVRKLTLQQLVAFADEPINMHRGVPVRAGEIKASEWEAKIAQLEDGIATRQATVAFYRSVIRTLEVFRADSIDEALRGDGNGRR